MSAALPLLAPFPGPRAAVVSGVARRHGIGRAVVLQLVEQGYTVVGLDIAPQQEPDVDLAPQPHANQQQQQEQQQQGRVGRYTYVGGCDVRRADHLRGLLLPAVQRAVEEGGCGGLNLLVNNAGVANPNMGALGAAAGAAGDGESEGGGGGGKYDGAVEAWRTFIDTNLTGAFLLSHVLGPLLVPSTSAIVHISSTRALMSEPGCEGYAAAKAGLIGLTHAQAASLSGRTRVNAVLPGWVDTSGGEESITAEQHAWHWTGRVGSPSDIARLVAFLGDERLSGFVTGQAWTADGGVTKRMHYPE